MPTVVARSPKSDAVLSNYSDEPGKDANTLLNGPCDSREPDILRGMSSLLSPLHLLLIMFAGWVNRHQLDVIQYLKEENRVLKDRLAGQRNRLTDAERRRLARKAHALGRNVLNWLETLVTPDTLLRGIGNSWHPDGSQSR